MNVKRLINNCPAGLFTAIVVVAILYLTLMPRPLPDMDLPLFPGADKLVHAIMMGGMMLCIGLDMARGLQHPEAVPKSKLMVAFIVTAAFGGAIELIQGAMKMGRGEDIYDFLADVIGALAGYFFLIIIWRPLVRWLRDR